MNLLLLAATAVVALSALVHRRDRLPAFVPIGALLIAAAVVLHPLVALAADTGATETVAQATGETTKITWAYGSIVNTWASAIGSLVLVAVMWLLRLLPGQVYAILVSLRADQLLQKAISYAINMVQGATAGKSLTIDVHNDVLAHAVQYVLDNAPDWLQSWLGGPDAIVQKIIARLNLDPNAVVPSTTQVLAQAAALSKG